MTPSPARLAGAALVLALAVPAGPVAAAEPQRVTGAYAYFQPTPRDQDYAGYAVVVLRTARYVPLDSQGNPRVTGRIDGADATMSTVSRKLRCFAMRSPVRRSGRGANGRAGDRVRVRFPRDGSLLTRRMTVRRSRAGLPRGGPLGCGADVASGAVIFNMYPTPLSQPGRFFFTANSGPYLEDIRWTGWGGETATGTGTYVYDCASCIPAESYPVTVTVSELIACVPYGARAYNRLSFVRASGARETDPKDRGIQGEAELYCR